MRNSRPLKLTLLLLISLSVLCHEVRQEKKLEQKLRLFEKNSLSDKEKSSVSRGINSGTVNQILRENSD